MSLPPEAPEDALQTLEAVRETLKDVLADSYRHELNQVHAQHDYALRLLSRAERRLTNNYKGHP